jgi:HK97 family phage portal protein
MTFFGRFFGWWGSIGSTTQNRGVQDTRPLQNVYKNAPEVAIDGALQVSAVWASIELLADNVASLPLFVYENQNGSRELARDNTLWRVLHDRPNSRHTPMEFWQFTIMNYLLRGNAYARIQRDSKGEVVALWPMASDQIQVTVLDNGDISYEYYINGKIVVYGQDSILHFRDKGNGIIGMSRLDYMKSSVGVAINAQNATSKLYTNDNKRPGVFMIDKTLTEEQRDQVRKNFAGLAESAEDDLLVLESGAKFEPLALSPQEVQLLETRKFSVEDIARWFGIPSILINDLANRVPYGNNNDLAEFFYKFKLRPLLVNFEQALTQRVMTAQQRSTLSIEFSLDALLRSNLKDRMEIYSQAVQNGLKTRNECRQLENDAPLPGGDMLTAQVNLSPLEMLGQQNEPVAPQVDTESQKMIQEIKSRLDHKEPEKAQNINIEVNMPESKTNVHIEPQNIDLKPEINVKQSDITINSEPTTINLPAPEVIVNKQDVDMTGVQDAIKQGANDTVKALKGVENEVKKPRKAVFDKNGNPIGTISTDGLDK